MPTVKRILCLANSRKLSGRCVAGREIVDRRPAGWVRPVSAREHEEVFEYERQYKDGSDPCVLDVIDVPLIEPRPRDYQRENWLLDPGRYWVKRGRLSRDHLERFVDPVAPLWINGYSTYYGCNDKIPLALAESLESSLRLIRVDRLRLSVFNPSEAFGNRRRRVQARFLHDGVGYALWVTDPRVERAYLARPDGSHEIGECYLTISLGEPYNDYCYKLVAAVISSNPRGAA